MIFELMMPIWEKAAKLIHKMCITRVTSGMAIEYSDMHFCIALCNVNRLDLALPGILLSFFSISVSFIAFFSCSCSYLVSFVVSYFQYLSGYVCHVRH